MPDMDRGLSDEWSDWRDGDIPTLARGEYALVGEVEQMFNPVRHRWRRYRHESSMLALLRTGGISMMLVSREGPVRPKEGA